MLSVVGALPGAQYRYVAVMMPTGSSAKTTGPRCEMSQTVGSGGSVPWHPRSGTYRITAYGPDGRVEADTLSLTYTVPPRVVMLVSSQMATDAGVMLALRTDDLGPGHTYAWSMQVIFRPKPTGTAMVMQPPLLWTKQTAGAMASYPTALPPIESIKATVNVHRGDPCDLLATGTMDR